VVLASVVGTVLEWYDFFIYGAAAALVFNQLFFPGFSDLAGTMAAFGTFALGFFARPLGGIIFGSLVLRHDWFAVILLLGYRARVHSSG